MVKKTLIGLLAASAATLALSAPASAADEVWWSLTRQVEPGGRIDAQVYSGLGHGCTPAGPVTSAGFTSPITMVGMGNWGRMGGSTTAIRRPGKYTASFPCSDGRKAVESFTITGTPPPTTTKPQPPTTKPKPPTAKPKPPKPAKPAKPQVAVKPAGAPQTGDGSRS
ncbi:hypothetical protein SAMN04489727_2449 [Amycolatopsis tolypomycina]|uniref:Uncharacterized protein n=1 Tax=Amycolatopsis tolypomycina TaxID=208445 RepID=A0A1H4PHR6_9PSEU|nr:hypothetical protein [Amycolatopsis tolypomycina]SEC06977.1 hypothetical protein SAMN04489727_2449 [Amycolatopsis tolypomycina]